MTDKRCSGCGHFKPVTAFNKLARAKDGLQPQCRSCQAEYFRDNREQIMPMIRARKERVHQESVRYVKAYLGEHPCVDCGETDLIVLYFDHVRGEKLASVSKMVREVWSLRRIKEEIA